MKPTLIVICYSRAHAEDDVRHLGYNPNNRSIKYIRDRHDASSMWGQHRDTPWVWHSSPQHGANEVEANMRGRFGLANRKDHLLEALQAIFPNEESSWPTQSS